MNDVNWIIDFRSPAAQVSGLPADQLYRQLLDINPDCIKLLGLAGDLQFISTNALRAMEIDDFASVKGLHWPDLWPPAEQAKVETALADAIHGGQARFQGACPTALGKERYWDVVITRLPSLIDGVAGLMCISRDITDLQQLGMAQSIEQARYELLESSTTDYVIASDVEGKIQRVSPSLQALGYQPDQLVGRSLAQLVHPADAAAFTDRYAALIQGQLWDDETEHRFRAADGGWLWLESNPRLRRDHQGRPAEIIDALRDVTERRRLQRDEERRSNWDALAHAITGVGCWRLDVLTSDIVWSPQMFKIYGVPQGDEPALTKAMEQVHPDDVAACDERLAMAIANGVGWDGAIARIVRPGGDIRYVESRTVCEQDESGQVTAILGTLIDITERCAAEQAIVDRDREAARLSERALLAAQAAEVGIWEWEIGPDRLHWDARMFHLYDVDPAPEVTFETFGGCLHPDDRARIVVEVEETLATGARFDTEFKVVHRSGEVRVMRALGRVDKDPAGAPLRMVGTNWDITSVRDLELSLRASEARYRLLAENATDIIMRRDLDGTITYCSPAIGALGWAPEQLVGQSRLDFLHPDDVAITNRIVERAIAGEPLGSGEYIRIRNTAGDYVWFEAAPSIIRDGQGIPVGLVNALRDVTERRAVEQELKVAKQAAEAATAAKSEFLANMSHEIRTPMTAIIGFSQLLAAQPNLDPTTQSFIQRVEKAGAALLSVVNDVLDFSKLESGQFEIFPEPVSLCELASDALSMLAPQAQAKGLVLSFVVDGAIPLQVDADPNRLRQILLNLLGNAVKFTDVGLIRLQLRYDREQGHAYFDIEDSGRGLSPAEQGKLFQRFSQVDSTPTRRHGGTGLGLAICKGLSEAMGGGISVQSQSGVGSTFSFNVQTPVRHSPSADETSAFFADMLDAVRILIIDNDVAARSALRALLEQCGAEVTETLEGEAGFCASTTMPYDIILLAAQFDEPQGSNALERLRAAPGPNQTIPVLVLSPNPIRGERPQLGRFQGVLTKPIEPQVLVASIQNSVRWDAGLDLSLDSASRA